MNKKSNIKNPLNKLLLALAVSLLFNTATAQTDSAGQNKKESAIELSFYKDADQNKIISALSTTTGEDNKWVPAANLNINFYSKNESGLSMLKTVLSNANGIATLRLPGDMPKDAKGFYLIIAKIENNNLYNDAEEQMEFKEANLTLKFNPADSAHMATALVTETGTNDTEIPVAETEVSFFVQRLFGAMPASEEFVVSTDENGEAFFSYPLDIMGDHSGKITLIAKIVDNKLFGTVETKKEAPWGMILPVETNPFPRSLSNPKAPLQLIITLVLIFGGIWTTYFFIFYQLRKISKDKQLSTNIEQNQQ